MHAAAILVDDDLVHEIFMAAPQRSRMFRRRQRLFEWDRRGHRGFINCPLPRILRLTGLQRNEDGFPKCSHIIIVQSCRHCAQCAAGWSHTHLIYQIIYNIII